MRNEQQVFDAIFHMISSCDNIRAAYMNGSRANPNAAKDELRDYDIVFSVKDIKPFVNDRSWLEQLGDVAIMQEPDRIDKALGENVDIDKSYTFLILFKDWVRIDLHIELTDITKLTYGSDSLTIPLIDKDGILKPIASSSDAIYRVKAPTEELYSGCCNEFFWCLNNMAKGIARKQLPYAMFMYNSIVHPMLIKLMCWRCSMEHGFDISLGISGKYLEKYLPDKEFDMLKATYPSGSYDELWRAADAAITLFSYEAKLVAGRLGFEYNEAWENAIKDYMAYIKAHYPLKGGMLVRNLTEADKIEICSWRYPGEYSIYNLPPYEEMAKSKRGFADPCKAKNYYCFIDSGVLVGFVNILEEEKEVFIGIGIKPELCDKHYGRRILDEAYKISKKLYPGKPLYLEVRTWNKRAVKCYQSAGYTTDGEPYELTTFIGRGEFYRMVKK